eukprot:TRINITY_DN42646_c0_g1_i1.p1 TRINITY_DN42646_c0_g1~~TRINITY_DN42646_c0_g1_i1.p1  ORF type:complete len:154 (+),score=26.70 TRINITY_DN42646_c0_g1_i1:49-462(+)
MLRRWCLAGARRAYAVSLKTEVGADAGAVTMTDSCVERIHKQNSINSEQPYLRLKIGPGGCKGAKYDFDWVEKPGAKDHVFEKGGAYLVVDDRSFDTLKGSQIDFLYEMKGNQFQVLRPGDKSYSACSCGESFEISA